MATLALYVAAALAEIAGCFALWAVVRHNASALWLLPGVLSLVLFAWLLTRVYVDLAGRAYAVYGGIYIAASLGWLWAVEGRVPDRWALRAPSSASPVPCSFSTAPDPHKSDAIVRDCAPPWRTIVSGRVAKPVPKDRPRGERHEEERQR